MTKQEYKDMALRLRGHFGRLWTSLKAEKALLTGVAKITYLLDGVPHEARVGWTAGGIVRSKLPSEKSMGYAIYQQTPGGAPDMLVVDGDRFSGPSLKFYSVPSETYG